MAWVQADIDALEVAIKGGTRRVRFADGREVEYASIDEMLKLRAVMKGAVAGASATPRYSFGTFTKS